MGHYGMALLSRMYKVALDLRANRVEPRINNPSLCLFMRHRDGFSNDMNNT